MWWGLEEEINSAAKRIIREHETYKKGIADENRRRNRRSVGKPRNLVVQQPSSWSMDVGFNPYIVRSRRKSIAHSITAKLKRGEYEPRRAASFEVPKLTGRPRIVSTFEIADEVISNRIMRSLIRKNLSKFSSRAYAYRSDLTPHDAIQFMQMEFQSEHRLFVADYDFSKFFERVSHEHVLGVMERLRIVRTPLEERIIQNFLTSPAPYADLTEKNMPAPRSSVGMPQGTSISLFLANLAASELDRTLERMEVSFVRYADDTLIWSRDYSRICEAVNALHAASDEIGAPINAEKSNGIRLLAQEGTRQFEFSPTSSVDYLGHTVGLRSTRIKDSGIEKIKNRLLEILYTNLLLEPLSDSQNLGQLTYIDRDYLTFLSQARRYLYGNLTETQVRKFQSGSVPPMSFKGVMSFYPLADDSKQLKDLDEWFATQTWLTLRKREQILGGKTSGNHFPWGMRRNELIHAQRGPNSPNPADFRLPSFSRMALIVNSAVNSHGFSVVSPGARIYNYASS